ncbi:MAG: DivIVA domain-containing protein [Clostridia bacterium]|nr:DivIVA domain-containing protein [Clostridia bacterium]
MLLTPLDIHNKEFKKSLRGYDTTDVDDFLDEVIKDFERIYKENLELQEKIKKQDDHLQRYKEIEETLQNTMVLAQKMAEEAKRNAEKETELAIWEARKKAEQIVSGAHDDVTEAIRKVEALKAQEKQMKMKLKTFLATQMQMLENDFKEEGDDPLIKKEYLVKNELLEDN